MEDEESSGAVHSEVWRLLRRTELEPYKIRAWFKECTYEKSGEFHFIWVKASGRMSPEKKDDGVFKVYADPNTGVKTFYLSWILQHYRVFMDVAFGEGKWVLKVEGQPRLASS